MRASDWCSMSDDPLRSGCSKSLHTPLATDYLSDYVITFLLQGEGNEWG